MLRMDEGDRISLTDGKGTVASGIIQFAERHKCNVRISDTSFEPRVGGKLHLCVSFTKNNGRNEWLLEKATELGVASIIPIGSARYNKTHIRHDRWEKILQSAILQSQQSYLPELSQLIPVTTALEQFKDVPQKFIAHCMDDERKKNLSEMLKPGQDAVVFIGPEGDFAPEEVNLCIGHGYTAVALGAQRLRTETAAISVAAYFNMLS
ncbi:16S rRNA (uracil(1498)-N(3))-methyltransferase [Nemorincola caseinilytica]|uniref:Ribosomal RNA small subunit methyltransferase E n=1 Tax=Nemorincola caseinilytica TaxID=2054315 RepID=A0ABP8NFI0_9BACT